MTEDKKEKGVPFDWFEGMSEMMSKFCAGESGFPDCASMAEMMKMKGWCGGPGAKEAGEEGEEKKSTCC
jgi:hypothetical protein